MCTLDSSWQQTQIGLLDVDTLEAYDKKFEQTSDNCCSIDIVTYLNNLKFPKHKEFYVVFSENLCNASAEDKNLVRRPLCRRSREHHATFLQVIRKTELKPARVSLKVRVRQFDVRLTVRITLYRQQSS